MIDKSEDNAEQETQKRGLPQDVIDASSEGGKKRRVEEEEAGEKEKEGDTLTFIIHSLTYHTFIIYRTNHLSMCFSIFLNCIILDIINNTIRER